MSGISDFLCSAFVAQTSSGNTARGPLHISLAGFTLSWSFFPLNLFAVPDSSTLRKLVISQSLHPSARPARPARARRGPMSSTSTGTDPQGRPLRQALDPVASPSPYLSSLSSAANGTLSIAKEVIMGSLQSEYRRSESVRILSDRECSTGTVFDRRHGASHRTILVDERTR